MLSSTRNKRRPSCPGWGLEGGWECDWRFEHYRVNLDALTMRLETHFAKIGLKRYIEANPSDAKYAQVWLSRLWNKFPRDTYWQLQGLCCPYTGLPTNIYALLQIGTTRPVFVWRPSGWEVVGCSHAQWIERETQRVRRKFYDCSTISVLGGEKSIDRSIHSTHSDSIRDFF